MDDNSLHHSIIKSIENCHCCATEVLHTHIITLHGKGHVTQTVFMGNYEQVQSAAASKQQTCLMCKSSCTVLCAGCQGVYCSLVCQRMHWPEHKNQCPKANLGDNKTENSAPASTPDSNNNPLTSDTGVQDDEDSSDALNGNVQNDSPTPILHSITKCSDVNLIPNTLEAKSVNNHNSSQSTKDNTDSSKNVSVVLPKAEVLKTLLKRPSNSNTCNSSVHSDVLKQQASVANMITRKGPPKPFISRETLNMEGSTNVILGYTTGAANIWLQKYENLQKLSLLFDKIQAEAFKGDFLRNAEVGDLCIARFPEDNQFYRAQILKIELDLYTVQYVDYGNECQVKLSDLLALPAQLSAFPAQAIACALAGIKLYPVQNVSQPHVIEMLTKLLLEKTIATVVAKVNEEKVLVELKNGKGERISDLLTKLDCIHPLNEGKHSDAPPKPQLQQQSYQPLRRPHYLQNTPQTPLQAGVGLSSPPRNTVISQQSFNSPPNGAHVPSAPLIQLSSKAASNAPQHNRQATTTRQLWRSPKAAVNSSQHNRSPPKSGQNRFRSQTNWNASKTSFFQKPQRQLPTSQYQSKVSEPAIRSMLKLLPKGEEIQCIVTHIDKQQKRLCLSAVISPDLEEVINVEKKINSESDTRYDSTFKPQKDECVAAFSVSDSCWYRAVVLQPTSGGYQVLYADYGNEEEVQMVMKLKPEHLKCPSMLLQTFLVGTVSPDEHLFFNSLQPNAVVFIAVKNISNGTVTIEILNGDKPRLSLIGCPWYQASLEPQSGSNEPSPQLVPGMTWNSSVVVKIAAKDMKQRTLEPMFIGHVVPGTVIPGICIQLDSEQQELEKMMQALNAYFVRDNLKPYNAVKGEMVCVRSTADLHWYRAQVDSIIAERVACVFLVDYGHIEEAHANNLQPLPEQFKQYPFFVICAELDSVPSSYLTSSALEFLHKQSWKVKVISQIDKVMVRLYDEHETFCVNDVLLEKCSEITNLQGMTMMMSSFNKQEERYFFDRFPHQRLLLGQLQELVICQLIDPLHVLCLPKNEETIQGVLQLNQEITDYCNCNLDVYGPLEQEICLVKSSSNNAWYRAVAIRINELDIECLFVDTGALETVKTCNIRRMPSKFANFPRQAVWCALAGTSKKAEWPQEMISKLLMLLPVSSVQEAKVIAKGTDVNYVISLPKVAKSLSQIGLFSENGASDGSGVSN